MAREKQDILVEIKGTCKKNGYFIVILWPDHKTLFFYEFPKNVKVIANFAYMILTLQSLDLDPLCFDIHLISMADIVSQ